MDREFRAGVPVVLVFESSWNMEVIRAIDAEVCRLRAAMRASIRSLAIASLSDTCAGHVAKPAGIVRSPARISAGDRSAAFRRRRWRFVRPTRWRSRAVDATSLEGWRPLPPLPALLAKSAPERR